MRTGRSIYICSYSIYISPSFIHARFGGGEAGLGKVYTRLHGLQHPIEAAAVRLVAPDGGDV